MSQCAVLYQQNQPQIIVGKGLPVDEELGILCPPEDVLLTTFSNLFIRKGRDIFT